MGHAQSPTGFGRVFQGLLPHLAAHYDVHHFGHNYHGQLVDGPWRIYPNTEPIDVFGLRRMNELIDELAPELILLVHDPWNISHFLRALGARQGNRKVVVYCPVDARILKPEVLAWVPAVSRVVTYTQFGKRIMESCLNGIGIGGAAIAVIPHGTSTDLFYPYDGEARSGTRAARERLRALLEVPEDSFVVLNASRNQPRKRIDISVQGFAEFARDKPAEVRLMLHMGWREVGWDVRSLAAEAGMGDRLLLTAKGEEHPALSDRWMNLIYNACDVGMNTAAAEGWGLASFEHAATGAAQLVPRHGGCAEIWDGHAAMLDPVRREPLGKVLEASFVSPKQVASALEVLYRDESYRRSMARKAYENATRPEYQWSVIAGRWRELFEALT